MRHCFFPYICRTSYETRDDICFKTYKIIRDIVVNVEKMFDQHNDVNAYLDLVLVIKIRTLVIVTKINHSKYDIKLIKTCE